MKALKIIGVILLILVLGIVIVNFAVGSKYDIQRSIEINAPAKHAYALVNDLKSWEDWGPWHKLDTAMEITYSENTAGKDAWYSWDGEINEKGTVTIVDVVENNEILTTVAFQDRGVSNGKWTFEENEGITTVTWGFKGEMPWMMSFMNLMMDDMVGAQFEKGLNDIKTLAEENATKTPPVNIEMVTVESMPFYSVTSELTFEDIQNSETYGAYFGELMAFLGDENLETMLGNPFVIYHTWDEENKVTKAEFCIPASAELDETDRVKKGTSHAGGALKAVKTGSYDTENEHTAMHAHAEENNISVGIPWEIYGDPETQGVYVEVYYPIMEEMSTEEIPMEE